MIPALRVERCNEAPVRPERDYVLYWMIASRRTRWNYGLERAVERARELGKPLVIFEPLSAGYRWACDRFHRFVIQGMEENGRRLADRPVTYYPYVEPAPGAGRGLLADLGRRASVVVTDEFPCFMLPKLVSAAASRLDVHLEQVDSNGLLPLRAAPRVFLTAASFRRFGQARLNLDRREPPRPDPLRGVRLPRLPGLPPEILRRWPGARFPVDLGALPIDHAVGPVALEGGAGAAEAVLDRFIRERLGRYERDRAHPDRGGTSGLSPYLHFGHLSAHEVDARVRRASGNRARGFLDQLLTWRELGFNMSSKRPGYDRYESLPAWARTTLAEHAGDPRPHLYTLEEFEAARTHDPIWNAAQIELRREGRIHNSLRMLWGKKILEWSESPQAALDIMIELNNKYALDGRDPNSYSGIFWILGRYDRPWGPVRPIFGKIRYMSSESAVRKLGLRGYVDRYAP